MFKDEVPQLNSVPPKDSGVRPRPTTRQLRRSISTCRDETETEGTNPRIDHIHKPSIPSPINSLPPLTWRRSGVKPLFFVYQNRAKIRPKKHPGNLFFHAPRTISNERGLPQPSRRLIQGGWHRLDAPSPHPPPVPQAFCAWYSDLRSTETRSASSRYLTHERQAHCDQTP